jgi:hypothetical protein
METTDTLEGGFSVQIASQPRPARMKESWKKHSEDSYVASLIGMWHATRAKGEKSETQARLSELESEIERSISQRERFVVSEWRSWLAVILSLVALALNGLLNWQAQKIQIFQNRPYLSVQPALSPLGRDRSAAKLAWHFRNIGKVAAGHVRYRSFLVQKNGGRLSATEIQASSKPGQWFEIAGDLGPGLGPVSTSLKLARPDERLRSGLFVASVFRYEDPLNDDLMISRRPYLQVFHHKLIRLGSSVQSIAVTQAEADQIDALLPKDL